MVRNGLAHNGGGGGGTNFLDHLFFVYGCVSPFKHTEILSLNTTRRKKKSQGKQETKKTAKQKRQQNKE